MVPGLCHLAETTRVPTVFVYIEEAHADDEWPVATPPEFAIAKQHTSLETRLASATKALAALPALATLPLYMDTMDNKFLRMYGAWPTQLYLFCDGRLALKATPYDAKFDVVEFWQDVKATLQMNARLE